MLHPLQARTTATSSWCCTFFEREQPQHQVDVAPSSNEDNRNIKLMLHFLWKRTTATSSWCCTLFKWGQPQHQADVALSLKENKCNIKLMLHSLQTRTTLHSLWIQPEQGNKAVFLKIKKIFIIFWKRLKITRKIRKEW